MILTRDYLYFAKIITRGHFQNEFHLTTTWFTDKVSKHVTHQILFIPLRIDFLDDKLIVYRNSLFHKWN